MVLLVAFLFIQNLTVIMAVYFLGYDLNYCVSAGSIALSGGHSTTIAWSPILIERYGIESAMEFGIAIATLGLISGGLVAGPVANWLIKKNNLS